jgi:hypothetical protein
LVQELERGFRVWGLGIEKVGNELDGIAHEETA